MYCAMEPPIVLKILRSYNSGQTISKTEHAVCSYVAGFIEMLNVLSNAWINEQFLECCAMVRMLSNAGNAKNTKQ